MTVRLGLLVEKHAAVAFKAIKYFERSPTPQLIGLETYGDAFAMCGIFGNAGCATTIRLGTHRSEPPLKGRSINARTKEKVR